MEAVSRGIRSVASGNRFGCVRYKMKKDRDPSLISQVVSPLAGLGGFAVGIGFLEMPGQGHDRALAAALLQFLQGLPWLC